MRQSSPAPQHASPTWHAPLRQQRPHGAGYDRRAVDHWQHARRRRQHGDVGLVLTQRALRDRPVVAILGSVAGAHVGRCRAVRVHRARLVVARHRDGQILDVGARSRRRVGAHGVDAAPGGCFGTIKTGLECGVGRARQWRGAGQWRSFRRGVGSARDFEGRIARAFAARRRGRRSRRLIARSLSRHGAHLTSAPGREDQREYDRGRGSTHATIVAPLQAARPEREVS
jgi:hypothetical protein